jgi:hypothetical protein
MARRIFKAVTLTAGLALAMCAAEAHAGRYHVYSCRTPAGESAPVDGWSGSVAAGGAFDDYALNTCAEGGALVAALGDETIHGAEIDRATWAFASPADTTGPNENLAFDECIYTLGCPQLGTFSAVFSPQNRVSVPTGSLGSRLFVNVNCGVIPGHVCEPNTGDPNGFAAASYIFAADLTLEDNEAPHAGNASGDLASASTVQRQSDLAFDATDSGSGVYEALFSVDGQVVQHTVLDSTSGRRPTGSRRSCTRSRASRRSASTFRSTRRRWATARIIWS